MASWEDRAPASAEDDPMADVTAMKKRGEEIKRGREALGWDQDRLAANATMEVPELVKHEQGTRGEKHDLLVQILKDRGVQFRDNEVIGPMSDSVLTYITLREDDRKLLLDIDRDGKQGRQVEAEKIGLLVHSALAKEHLIELGTVQETISFPSGIEARLLPCQIVRVTSRGHAWIKLHAADKVNNDG